MKFKLIRFAFILIIVSLITSISFGEEKTYEKAEVLEFEEQEDEFNARYQNIKLRLLTGDDKGKEIEIVNYLSDNEFVNIPIEKGKKVLLLVDYEDGNVSYYIASEVRDHYIFYLIILFLLVILFVGRIQGIKTIITLGITFLFIAFVELPLLSKGYNPVYVTIFVGVLITIITIFIISGRTKKSLAAILGTIIGVLFAGTLSIIVSMKSNLTGMNMEEAMILASIYENGFNFQHLLFSGIILGSLGAIMDVAMSISSSIEEIYKVNPNRSKRKLYRSGIRVGRDIMGTMANTLILAYVGSSLPMLLLFTSIDDNMTRIINLDIIATEFIRSIAGSIGLVLAIPATAFISVYMIRENKKEKTITE